MKDFVLGSASECLEFLITLQKLSPRNFITVKLDSVLFLLPWTVGWFVFKWWPLNSLHHQTSSGHSLIFNRGYSSLPQTFWGSLWEIQMSGRGKINSGGAETWASLNWISPPRIPYLSWVAINPAGTQFKQKPRRVLDWAAPQKHLWAWWIFSVPVLTL